MCGLDCVGVLGFRGVNGFAAGLSTYFFGPELGLFSVLLPAIELVDVDVGSTDEFVLLILFPLLLLLFELLLLLLLRLLFTVLVADGGVP